MAKKSSKLTREKKREVAFELYCLNQLTQKEICEQVGWTEKTFTEVKQKEKWASFRGASKINKQSIINKLLAKLDALSDSTDLDADEISKVASAIDRLDSSKTSVPNMLQAFQKFTTWLFIKDAEMAKKVNEYQREYVNEVLSNEAN